MDEIKAVIIGRQKKWGSDPKMREFIRPSTIFAPANFDKYLNEIPESNVKAVSDNSLLKVRDMYGTIKHVTQAQFDKAEEGFFDIIE
jgi:hypothetical protein